MCSIDVSAIGVLYGLLHQRLELRWLRWLRWLRRRWPRLELSFRDRSQPCPKRGNVFILFPTRGFRIKTILKFPNKFWHFALPFWICIVRLFHLEKSNSVEVKCVCNIVIYIFSAFAHNKKIKVLISPRRKKSRREIPTLYRQTSLLRNLKILKFQIHVVARQ